MDERRTELLDRCDQSIQELLAAAAAAQEHVIEIARLLADAPSPLTYADDGGLAVETDDALRSIRASRHGLRDVQRIALGWQRKVADEREQDARPSVGPAPA